jgi:phospholipid N-methyltransferase
MRYVSMRLSIVVFLCLAERSSAVVQLARRHQATLHHFAQKEGIKQRYLEEVDAIATLTELGQGKVVAEVGAGDGSMIKGVGKAVMPGGSLFATEGKSDLVSYLETSIDIEDTLRGNAHVMLGTNSSSGLPKACCDAIFLRHVYHMMPAATALSYLDEFSSSLKPGGHLLLLEPYPGSVSKDGVFTKSNVTTREGAYKTWHGGGKMQAVPQNVAIAETASKGYTVSKNMDEWGYIPDSYALLLRKPEM